MKIRKFFGVLLLIISVIFGAVSIGLGYGMEYEEEVKPEDFYSLFQYAPESGQYYYIYY